MPDVGCCAAKALGQPLYDKTAVVDPTMGAGNYQTIAAAIQAITPQPGEHWTIRIHGGTYAQPPTLGPGKERIDLEGVDRDAVVISVAVGTAITISGDPQTSMRENGIRNLTVKTTNGNGIAIQREPMTQADPQLVTIEDVTVEAGGSGKVGVSGAESKNVRVANCNITANDGDGLLAGSDWIIERCAIEGKSQGRTGVKVSSEIGGRIEGCQITGTLMGLLITQCEKIHVRGTRVRAGPTGTSIIQNSPDILFENCYLFADGTINEPLPGPVRRDVEFESATAIHAGVGIGQSLPPTNQPDIYRLLSAKANQINTPASVYITGTNWAGDPIVERIDVDNTTNVIPGSRPFKSVSLITVEGTGSGTVAVGTLNRAGLYYPISSSADVIQQARKAPAANSYTIMTIGSIDPTYATVGMQFRQLQGGDSFEWSYLATK